MPCKRNRTELKSAPKPAHDRLHALAEDYLLERRANRDSKTAEYEAHLLRHFLDYCRTQRLTPASLSRRDWLRFVASLRETPYSAWTVRGAVAVAGRFLKWLHGEGFLPEPIVRQGDLPKPPPPCPTPLNLAQLQCLLALCAQRGDWRARRDYAMMATLIDSGLRRSELLQLTVRDALTGCAIVRQKGNRYLRVYLNESTCLAIRAYLRAYTRETGRELEPDDLVWRGVDGKPLTGNAVRQVFKRLSKACGERLYAHRLRSTSITLRLAAGASTELVREAVGHADERSLRHYAKLAEADKARLIRETSPLALLSGKKRRRERE